MKHTASGCAFTRHVCERLSVGEGTAESLDNNTSNHFLLLHPDTSFFFCFYAQRPTSSHVHFTDECRNCVFTGSISPEGFPKLKEVILLFPHLTLQHPVFYTHTHPHTFISPLLVSLSLSYNLAPGTSCLFEWNFLVFFLLPFQAACH